MMGRNDLNWIKWDTSDFPILCESCLGVNPYVRMIKSDFDRECKICTRPFNVFSWKGDKNSRYKKTEICVTCAKLKNVCQTCLFDLQFGLPVEVRDKYWKNKIEMPKDAANRDYFTVNCTKNIDKWDWPYNKEDAYPKWKEIINDNIVSFSASNIIKPPSNSGETPHKNLPRICTFFLKGTCSRGLSCPYRHEIPNIEEYNNMNTDNFEQRYHGIQDPIARKIINNYNDNKIPTPPKDATITTIYINGITDTSVKEKEILTMFTKYGEWKGVKMCFDSCCIFITFVNRKDAEKCMENMYNKCIVNMEKYKWSWSTINDSDLVTSKKTVNASKKEIINNNYKTRCPLYEEENNSAKENADKEIIGFNWTSYDQGEKPKYAAMDPCVKGGLLKRKRNFEGEDDI